MLKDVQSFLSKQAPWDRALADLYPFLTSTRVTALSYQVSFNSLPIFLQPTFFFLFLRMFPSSVHVSIYFHPVSLCPFCIIRFQPCLKLTSPLFLSPLTAGEHSFHIFLSHIMLFLFLSLVLFLFTSVSGPPTSHFSL